MPLGIPHSVFLGWDDDDQDAALAYRRAKNELCQSCGTRKADWEQDRHAFVAESDRCPGCELIEQERDNIPGSAKGVRTFLVPRAVSEATYAAQQAELGPADG